LSTFGDIERIFADLYPYRWAFAAGVLVLRALLTGYGYWKGWHRTIWRYRLPVGIVSIPMLALTIWLGWSLGSPLFTNTTVDEEFPFAFTAQVPPNMEREDVELVMSGIAQVDMPVNEPMPTMAAEPPQLVDQTKLTPPSDDETANQPAATEPPAAPALSPTSTPVAEPTLTPPPTPAPVGPMKLKVCQFQDIDSFHKGSGEATIYRGPDGSHLLRLENFEVTNGPDLHVILSPREGPQEIGGRLKTEGYVDLGKLKGNMGNQNYEIPPEVDIEIHNTVTIYCTPFHVIFSVAVLQQAT
jgi:hypothetical protein